MTDREALDAFEQWWAKNHPWDWYNAADGTPCANKWRLRMWDMCKSAYLREERAQPGSRATVSGDSTP